MFYRINTNWFKITITLYYSWIEAIVICIFLNIIDYYHYIVLRLEEKQNMEEKVEVNSVGSARF